LKIFQKKLLIKLLTDQSERGSPTPSGRFFRGGPTRQREVEDLVANAASLGAFAEPEVKKNNSIVKAVSLYFLIINKLFEKRKIILVSRK